MVIVFPLLLHSRKCAQQTFGQHSNNSNTVRTRFPIICRIVYDQNVLDGGILSMRLVYFRMCSHWWINRDFCPEHDEYLLWMRILWVCMFGVSELIFGVVLSRESDVVFVSVFVLTSPSPPNSAALSITSCCLCLSVCCLFVPIHEQHLSRERFNASRI